MRTTEDLSTPASLLAVADYVHCYPKQAMALPHKAQLRTRVMPLYWLAYVNNGTAAAIEFIGQGHRYKRASTIP